MVKSFLKDLSARDKKGFKPSRKASTLVKSYPLADFL